MQVGAFVHIEVGEHGIFSDDGRQHRLIGVDEVARIDQATADAAAEGGRHARVVEIDLGPIAGRRHGADVGDGLVAVGNGLVVFFLLDAVGGNELPVPNGLLGLECALRLSHLQIGLGQVEVGLVGPRVDAEEQFALVNHVAFLERRFHHIPGDARPHVHGLDRIEPAGEILVIRDLVGDLRGDDNLDRLRRLWPRRAIATRSKSGCHQSHR